jgi:hypothetical protein
MRLPSSTPTTSRICSSSPLAARWRRCSCPARREAVSVAPPPIVLVASVPPPKPAAGRAATSRRRGRPAWQAVSTANQARPPAVPQMAGCVASRSSLPVKRVSLERIARMGFAACRRVAACAERSRTGTYAPATPIVRRDHSAGAPRASHTASPGWRPGGHALDGRTPTSARTPRRPASRAAARSVPSTCLMVSLATASPNAGRALTADGRLPRGTKALAHGSGRSTVPAGPSMSKAADPTCAASTGSAGRSLSRATLAPRPSPARRSWSASPTQPTPAFRRALTAGPWGTQARHARWTIPVQADSSARATGDANRCVLRGRRAVRAASARLVNAFQTRTAPPTVAPRAGPLPAEAEVSLPSGRSSSRSRWP